MKKVLTLLFAFMACSWSLLPAANVKVRTLIPTDSEFSTTGTIVFSWKKISGGAWTDVVLTREGTSRWWGATVVIPDETNFTYSIKTETSATTKDVTEIGGWSPSSYIAKDNLELNIEVQALYIEMPNERTFMTGEVPATAEDHDYRISNLKVEDIGNGVTITWDANNFAPYYYISLMDDANTWSFDKFVTVTEGKFTYYYDGTDDIHLGTLIFFPCSYDGTNYLPYVKMYQEALDINFKSPQKIIEESLTAVQKDKTIEISWNHYPAVEDYYINVTYDNWMKELFVMPKYTPAKDGKYTFTFDELPGNGDYFVTFIAENENGSLLAEIIKTLEISAFPALGEVELRALIPDDNDMNISFGVWFEWIDVETQTPTIVKADMDADGVWFSKKITTDKSAIQFRVCNTSDASGSNSQLSPIINTAQACYELQYQQSHAWELLEAQCDAPNHDYRITNIQAAVSNPVSVITFTITSKDYAPAYKFEARPSGTGNYQSLAILPYKESNTFTCPIPFTAAGDYEFRITPLNNVSLEQVAEEKIMTVTLVSGNMNMPTNLAATVGTDKQTVTFTWTQPSPSQVDHYTLEISDLGAAFEFENIFDTNYSVKLYGTRTHRVSWVVNAYSADGVLLAKASRGDELAIVSEDYKPNNLNADVNGNKATMTWETLPDVQTCVLYMFDMYTGEEWTRYVQGADGKFSATYLLEEDKSLLVQWSVMAVSPEGVPMSNTVDGQMFTLTGKIPEPRVPQTKEMTPTIGYLHWDENHSTWSATVYEYDATETPLFVFNLSVPGNKTTIPKQITLTNNTNDDNLFSDIPSGGEDPEFGDVIKNANLTVTYDGGIRTKDDGSGGITIYVLAKVSGEMNSDFGDKLIVNQSANFVEFYVTGIEPPTNIDSVKSQSTIVKFIQNGQLLIQHGNKLFNAQGARVK